MEYNFKKVKDLRGNLIAIDSINDLPFEIKRFFYINNVDNLPRGFHAHKKCEQILIPIQGSFDLHVELKNGEKKIFNLNKDNYGIYIPLLSWVSMENFSSGCILMVICSYKYDEEEYIRNYGDYLEIIRKDKINNNKIKNFDLNIQTKKIKKEIMNKIENIIDNGSYTLGKELEDFENNFAIYNKTKYCVGVSNGTSALKIAFKSLNLDQQKCEIIFQANTYIAVPLVADELKLNMNIIDIDNNLLLDLNKLELFLDKNKNQEKTFVLFLVHLYGYCVNMDKLMELKEKYNFYLIEDTAQAHGAEFNGKKLGSFGEIGCFSFYPSKNLGAYGEGGAIVTNNESYYNYAKKYRNYGCIAKYEWEIKGFNERMHNIQAAILDVKLKYLDNWNENRTKLANIYIENLKDNKLIKLPTINEKCKSNYHLFVIITSKRDELKKYLEENNVQCAIHYPRPFYKSSAFQELNDLFLENMEELKDNLLSLPMYPELEEEKVLHICELIKNFE
jgi:dTDP-4-amino-4,6-dideoxygalactose transaminase